jgi:hypothetical protein
VDLVIDPQEVSAIALAPQGFLIDLLEASLKDLPEVSLKDHQVVASQSVPQLEPQLQDKK